MCFTEAENVKRKSVSEPSWERIDHVYTSALYLSLSLPLSACRAHLSPSLSPSLICHTFFFLPFPTFPTASSSFLSQSLLLFSPCSCLFLSCSVMQCGNTETRSSAVNFVLNEGEAPIATTCHTNNKMFDRLK